MWLISLPAWGTHHVDTLLKFTIPSLKVCDPPDVDMRVIVHTDQADKVTEALPGVETLPVPGNGSYLSMSAAHREVIALAQSGDYVTLMCADVIFSRECFAATERRFKEGFKAVACIGTRTIGPLFGNPPPIGYSAGELLDWSMRHRHPIITQCFWPQGRTSIPSQIYFEDEKGGGIAARVFTPCLFAVVADRNLAFTGTIDRDLLECFRRDEIHMVTGRDELAVVEVSPYLKSFGHAGCTMSPAYIAKWARESNMHDLNYWFFSHRMEITGDAGKNDEAPFYDIMMEAGRPC